MRALALALTAFAFLGVAAPASAETIDELYGNTLTVRTPDGATEIYHFEPGGTFTIQRGNGERVSANWVIEGANIRFTRPDNTRDCTSYPTGKKVGDTWNYTSNEGATLVMSITRGR